MSDLTSPTLIFFLEIEVIKVPDSLGCSENHIRWKHLALILAKTDCLVNVNYYNHHAIITDQLPEANRYNYLKHTHTHTKQSKKTKHKKLQ